MPRPDAGARIVHEDLYPSIERAGFLPHVVAILTWTPDGTYDAHGNPKGQFNAWSAPRCFMRSDGATQIELAEGVVTVDFEAEFRPGTIITTEDRCMFEGRTYDVLRVADDRHPDGYGFTRVQLREAR